MFAFPVEDLLKRGSIRDADVQRIRRAVYALERIDRATAEVLFSINSGCRVQDPSWSAFFIEAITDYVVDSEAPSGYLTAEHAQWLIDAVSRDGRVETHTELELLIHVLDAARWVPVRLCRFVLAQVKRAVIEGEGPLRSGQSLQPGEIGDGEVEILGRALFAFAGGDSIGISREEAEVLFDISDALADAPPNPLWCEFFAKALTNAVMGVSGYKAPPREEALRLEQWLDARGELSPSSLYQKLTGLSLSSVLSAYKAQSPEERAIERLERHRREIITCEPVTEIEAKWLAERILRDGRMVENEVAFLRYLAATAVSVHPDLQALIAKAQAA